MTATADGSQISLVVDDYDVYMLDTPNSNLIIPATPIYFGGVPDTFALAAGASATDTPFLGCIGDTTVNGKLINYASSTGNQGASIAKCPLPDGPAVATGSGGMAGTTPLKPKRIEDASPSEELAPIDKEEIAPPRQPPSVFEPVEPTPPEGCAIQFQ